MTEQQTEGQQTEPEQKDAPTTSLPEAPTAPPLIPAPAPPADPVPPVRKDRRVLRAALRWTAVVAVFAAVGASAAYGITRMERTDVPGLATEPDGRWEYPVLVRPPLPSGSPAPFADVNPVGAHYADLRALVLPAPKGAEADEGLAGEDGWLAKKDFLSEYADGEDRDEFSQVLTDNGLRHIAARGWRTQDGTHTRTYLLQFDTAAVAERLFTDIAHYDSPEYPIRGGEEAAPDAGFSTASLLRDIRRSLYVEPKPYGAEQVRHAYLSAGDTIALIVQSRKGEALAVPFQQTVTLQSQLLG
ncbi:hypothetical protein [Streptomyces sp. SID12501]|uniref:Uncharacterized protein n=1 Tax=Streptomyces sp. SID12501 TaxID=2706042 RepID=A0A6B3C3S6_9ACTN|nr:hypothetical protein [Streptomyces sp. SID12501]NEC90982.1 hypothetical protein [Streptomyces sp. SID12501]